MKKTTVIIFIVAFLALLVILLFLSVSDKKEPPLNPSDKQNPGQINLEDDVSGDNTNPASSGTSDDGSSTGGGGVGITLCGGCPGITPLSTTPFGVSAGITVLGCTFSKGFSVTVCLKTGLSAIGSAPTGGTGEMTSNGFSLTSWNASIFAISSS